MKKNQTNKGTAKVAKLAAFMREINWTAKPTHPRGNEREKVARAIAENCPQYTMAEAMEMASDLYVLARTKTGIILASSIWTDFPAGHESDFHFVSTRKAGNGMSVVSTMLSVSIEHAYCDMFGTFDAI